MKHPEVRHLKTTAYYKSLFKPMQHALALNDDDLDFERLMRKKPCAKRASKKHLDALAQRRPRRPDGTYHWGPGLMTWHKKNSSWQATCPRCRGAHINTVRVATSCRQTRKVNREAGMTDEMCQLVLKHWINVCGQYPTRLAHQRYKPKPHDIPTEDEVNAAQLPVDYDSDADPIAVRDVKAGPLPSPAPGARRRPRKKAAAAPAAKSARLASEASAKGTSQTSSTTSSKSSSMASSKSSSQTSSTSGSSSSEIE